MRPGTRPHHGIDLIPSVHEAVGIYPANPATVAWCTAMVVAIDRQLLPAAKRFRASACWCAVSLGLRPNHVPLALAAVIDTCAPN